MSVPSWLTVAIFAERMGITTPTGSALTIANMALESAAGMVTNYLGFDPSVTAITEYLDGYGKRDVALRRWPVTAVTSVYEDLGGYNGQPTTVTPFAADTLLTVGEDYTWCRSEGGTNGILTRIGGLWPYNWTREINRVAFSVGPLRGCLKVVYTIDNSDVLAAAQQAAYLEATAQYRGMVSGMGTALSDGMDGANLSVTALQRANSNDSRDVFASPYAAGILRLYRQGGLV